MGWVEIRFIPILFPFHMVTYLMRHFLKLDLNSLPTTPLLIGNMTPAFHLSVCLS